MPSRPETRRVLSAADKLTALQRHPMFGGVAPHFIERLSTHATIRTFPKGATIFTKGDRGTSLFAVCTGTVRIAVPSHDGRDAVFNVIKGGEIFGEIALLDGRPRTADATAMTDCQLILIDRGDFVALVESRLEIALKLIEVLCARIRRTSEQVEDVLFLDLPGRLAKLLLHLAENTEVSGRPDRKILMTQREIGRMIGVSRESTNKQLREWKERNWVRLERGSIVILALDALAAIGTPATERVVDAGPSDRFAVSSNRGAAWR